MTPLLPVAASRKGAAGEGLVMAASNGETRTLHGPCLVGSGKDCDWVLADPYVSQQHLMMIPDGDCLRVSDRGSRNGTFLHGAAIERALLQPGACLTLGQTQLRLRGPAGPVALVGESPAFKRLLGQIQDYGPLDLPVLLQGESGTGKDVIARALHQVSGRRGEFTAVNCGALPRELIESELFGHERGAFTGAHQRRQGCFAEAQGGTIFLDEVAEMPLDLQPRLLRVLENRAIRPVGTSREIPIDVRVIAATHCDLEAAVNKGRFRADLYYRLAGLDLFVPALRERAADIPALVRHFLAELRGSAGVCQISDEELRILMAHRWPGNVRQLRHAVVRAASLCGPVLKAKDILSGQRQPAGGGEGAVPVLGRRFSEIERDIYQAVLQHTNYNLRQTAAALDVPRSSVSDKLRRFGLAVRRGARAL